MFGSKSVIALPERETAAELEQDDPFGLEELGQRAAKLGYAPLLERVQKDGVRARILAFLAERDLLPFKLDSVEAYKAAQVRREHRWLDSVPAADAGGLSGIFLFLAVVSGISAIISMAPSPPYWRFGCTLLPVFVASLWFFFRFHQREKYNVSEARWAQFALSQYNRPVPEYVLQTAVDLGERFPGGEFYIDELQPRTVARRPRPDPSEPFLVWRYDGQPYYLEVWNEPRFRGKREC